MRWRNPFFAAPASLSSPTHPPARSLSVAAREGRFLAQDVPGLCEALCGFLQYPRVRAGAAQALAAFREGGHGAHVDAAMRSAPIVALGLMVEELAKSAPALPQKAAVW